MGSRQGLSSVLILGALVLVVAIFVGNSMGSRVLGQIATRSSTAIASPIPTPTSSPPDDVANRALWKRRQVLSVATDPAFPDPRVTPEPPMPATPRPKKETPKPPAVTNSDAFGQQPTAAPQTPDTTYTSPPMPIPLVSHGPDEVSPDEEPQTPSPRGTASGAVRPPPSAPSRVSGNVRSYPTLPPVSQPTFNP